MAPIEKNLVAQCKRFGEPLPERIKNKPRLGLGLDIFLDAFFDLEYDRNWLVGTVAQPLPISWGTLQKYAEIYEFSGILRDDLLYLVRALDNAYINYINKKSK